jgi:hypothetical protein
MGGIMIPKALTSKPKTKGKQSKSSSSKKSGTQQLRSLEELGIPMDLNFFNQSILYSQGDKFSTVAWTTLDDVRREFFNINHKGIGYWTKDRCEEEAKKYKNRVEFMHNSAVAYMKARDVYNCLDEICNHMPSPLTKWNYDLALKTAKKYKTRNELKLSEQTCWQWIKRNKLDDIMFAHMKPKQIEYNLEELKKEAKQFQYRVDWKNFNPKGYKKVMNEGLLNEYCKHMFKNKFHDIKMIEEILKENNIKSIKQLKNYDIRLYHGLYRAKTLEKFNLTREASNQFLK